MTVHFEHDGAPILLLLDIVEVAELHSGVNLAVAFAKILKDYGIQEKVILFNVVHWYIITDQPCYQILGVTCDNASSNDTMVDMLMKVLKHFPGHANCVQCMAHIVNLVVKLTLRRFDTPRKKVDSKCHSTFSFSVN